VLEEFSTTTDNICRVERMGMNDAAVTGRKARTDTLDISTQYRLFFLANDKE